MRYCSALLLEATCNLLYFSKLDCVCVLECVCVLYLYIFVSVLSQEVLHVMEFTVKHLSPHQALSQHIIHCLLLFVIIFRSSLLPPLLLYYCISST